MIKILQILSGFYPRIGGIEQVAMDIMNVLKTNKNIEQKIICFNEDAEVGDIKTHRKETVHDKVDGVDVIRCGCIAKIASQLISLTYPKELSILLNSFDPDIIIFHYPNPYLAAFLLPMIKKHTKLIVYWHLDITKQKILGKIFHGQNLSLIKRAYKIVGATPMHIDQSAYTRYFGNKRELLPYMIDEKSLLMSKKEIQKADKIREKYKGKTIGFFIGRHVSYKGLKYLIEASKFLENRNFKFLIAGSGPLTDELKTQSKGDEKIEFLGRISSEERREYLYACDIICFPSITKNEAFGLALAEGMYFGKPAVTFTIPGSGVNYVNLDGVTGIECPNCDSKAYARALKKLADDAELRKRLGENARQRIVENFMFDKFKVNVMEVIKETIERK